MDSYPDFCQIAQQHGSPFYLFERDAFVRNFTEIHAAFGKRYTPFVIGYSYKTNYVPYLCRLARELGGYAEVVSRLELDLALRLGCAAAEIIYNGPVKTDEDLAFALEAGVTVNLDTLRELEEVLRLAQQFPHRQFRIGLRINIPLLDGQGESHVQEKLPLGRFGFSESSMPTVVRLIGEVANLHVSSLHGHASSSDRSLWVYRTIAGRLAEVGGAYFADTLEFLNVGGGFYGHPVPAMGLVETPDFDAYAEAICTVLQRHPWLRDRHVRLVVEPGMAVAADAMSFVTRVFEVKNVGGRRLAVVDGSIFNVKPTMHSRNHPFSVIKPSGASGSRGCYSVVGATCMEKDRLLQEVECDEINRGDFIRIENVGAYTVVLTPPFIHPAPPILLRSAAGYEAIRRRQNFEDLFGSYLF